MMKWLLILIVVFNRIVVDELPEPIDTVIDFAFTLENGTLHFWTIEQQDSNYWIRLYEDNQLIYENDFTKVKPWCIDVGDIDGDQKYEVLIGTYNKTIFYDEAKRPFVFNWNGEYLSKQWTGSFLSFNELLDMHLEDVNNDQVLEIVTLEKDQNNKEVTYCYLWCDFGFTQEKYMTE